MDKNKQIATEVINNLKDKETYSSQFLNGMYFGVLITLDSQDKEVEKVKNKEEQDQQLFNNSLFKRIGIAFGYIFTKKINGK